jgi:hypothetical protein
MTRCGEPNERFIDGSVSGDGSSARIFWALHLAAVRLLGSRVLRGWPGNPGSDGASPYHLEHRSSLGAILLVLVVVLVLDLLRLASRLLASTLGGNHRDDQNDDN